MGHYAVHAHRSVVKVAIVTLVVVGMLGCVRAVGMERRLKAIHRTLERPAAADQVIMLYKGGEDAESVREAAQVAKEEGWDFVKCDITKQGNQGFAKKKGVTATPVVLVRAVGEAAERFPHPVDMLGVHLQAKRYAGNPQDIIKFTSEDDFTGLVNSPHNQLPVFARFTDAGCAPCRAMERVFQQGAMYFKDDCVFVDSGGDFGYERDDYSLLSFDEFFVQHQQFFGAGDDQATLGTSASEGDAGQNREPVTVDVSAEGTVRVPAAGGRQATETDADAGDVALSPVGASRVLHEAGTACEARLEDLERTVAAQGRELERLSRVLAAMRHAFDE